jgi:hypothetical protein
MVGGCVGRRLKEVLESKLGLWWNEGNGEKISSHVGAGGSRSGNSLEITTTRSNDLNLNQRRDCLLCWELIFVLLFCWKVKVDWEICFRHERELVDRMVSKSWGGKRDGVEERVESFKEDVPWMRFKVLWKLGLKVLLTVEEVVDRKRRRIGWRVWGFK